MRRLAPFVLLMGCQSLVDGAREEFSRSITCPLERVEGKARPDLHVSDFKDKPTPPREIAADPERLKMWQQKQDESREWYDRRDEIFEMKGCGHEQFLACHKFKNGSAFCTTQEKRK